MAEPVAAGHGQLQEPALTQARYKCPLPFPRQCEVNALVSAKIRDVAFMVILLGEA